MNEELRALMEQRATAGRECNRLAKLIDPKWSRESAIGFSHVQIERALRFGIAYDPRWDDLLLMAQEFRRLDQRIYKLKKSLGLIRP